jgi:hypothetical protein
MSYCTVSQSCQDCIWAVHMKPAPPFYLENSLAKAWASSHNHCDSALGIKLRRPIPVHLVEVECAFSTTPPGKRQFSETHIALRSERSQRANQYAASYAELRLRRALS